MYFLLWFCLCSWAGINLFWPWKNPWSEQKSIFLSAQRNPNNNDPQAVDIFEDWYNRQYSSDSKADRRNYEGVGGRAPKRSNRKLYKIMPDYFEVDVNTNPRK